MNTYERMLRLIAEDAYLGMGTAGTGPQDSEARKKARQQQANAAAAKVDTAAATAADPDAGGDKEKRQPGFGNALKRLAVMYSGMGIKGRDRTAMALKLLSQRFSNFASGIRPKKIGSVL